MKKELIEFLQNQPKVLSTVQYDNRSKDKDVLEFEIPHMMDGAENILLQFSFDKSGKLISIKGC